MTTATVPETVLEEEEAVDAPHDEMMNGGGGGGTSTNTTNAGTDTAVQPLLMAPNDGEHFPQTESELIDFLSKIDGDCPYESEKAKEADPAFQESVFQSKDVRVDPSSKLKIPIPIMVAHSSVEWTINIHERDVGFAISHPNEEDNNEGEELSEIQWLVEPHWVYAPLPEGEEQELPEDEGGPPSKIAPQKGRFKVGGNINFPTTILLEFDNTYSWITEKLVAYTIKVIPPADPKKVEREKRAKKVLPLVIQAKKDAESKLAKTSADVQNSSQDIKDKVSQLSQIQNDINTKKSVLEKNQSELEMIDEARKLSMKTLQMQKTTLEEHDKKVAELAAKLKLMLKEKDDMEIEIKNSEQECALADGQYHRKKSDIHKIDEEMKDCQKQTKTCTEERINAIQIHDDMLIKEKNDTDTIDFLQRQIDELKLRML